MCDGSECIVHGGRCDTVCNRVFADNQAVINIYPLDKEKSMAMQFTNNLNVTLPNHPLQM